MWLKLLVGISLVLISDMPLGWAESVRIGPVYTKKPGEVSVVVQLPPGVTPTVADFRLLADDNPVATAQEMKPFRDSGRGMALAVCIDVSGTMARGPLDDAKKALLTFLKGARPEDRIALILFADEEVLASSFGETRAHLNEAAQSLKPRGNKTRLYQTIYKTLDIFEGSMLPERRRIVVISDGKDEGSLEDAADVINKANKLGIPIDAVGRARIEEQYAEALRGLSNSTGGYFEHARRDVRTATDALAAIYEKLSSSLVVDFHYAADDSGHTTQNAWLELQQRDQPPSRIAIPGAISQVMSPPPAPGPKGDPKPKPALEQGTESTQVSRPEPTPETPPEPVRSLAWMPAWLWLLLAGLLVVILVGGVRWAKRTNASDPGAEVTPLPPIDFDRESSLQGSGFVQPPQRTQVGGYHFPVPAIGEPTAVLFGVSGPMKGQQFSIEREIVHIGAHAGNDLSIAGDEYLSGNHAYLHYKQGSLFLFDKGSTNGSFVNRLEVTAAGITLSIGDHIQLGASVFELGKGPS